MLQHKFKSKLLLHLCFYHKQAPVKDKTNVMAAHLKLSKCPKCQQEKQSEQKN